MTEKVRRDFCIECRKETEYLLQKRDMVKTIKDKSYKFEITVAVCMECGGEMSIPGLIDKNIQEIDEQYRALQKDGIEVFAALFYVQDSEKNRPGCRR